MRSTNVEFRYAQSTDKSVTQAIVALHQALTDHKFSSLVHLDMASKLREKGIDLEAEFHIFEVCNAPRAKEALETNVEVGYFLPCKMAVYKKDGQTYVGTIRPQVLMELAGEERLEHLATDVDEILRAVVDEAVH